MVMTDNLDLAIRRKRVDRKQRDVRAGLKGANGKHPSISAISDFENGERDDLPHGLGRADYDALLTEWERERGGS